jgi:hypothetical protein
MHQEGQDEQARALVALQFAIVDNFGTLSTRSSRVIFLYHASTEADMLSFPTVKLLYIKIIGRRSLACHHMGPIPVVSKQNTTILQIASYVQQWFTAFIQPDPVLPYIFQSHGLEHEQAFIHFVL